MLIEQVINNDRLTIIINQYQFTFLLAKKWNYNDGWNHFEDVSSDWDATGSPVSKALETTEYQKVT